MKTVPNEGKVELLTTVVDSKAFFTLLLDSITFFKYL